VSALSANRDPKEEVLMKFARALFSVAIAVAFASTLFAQQAPSGYHRVACVKIKPDKAAEYSKFSEDVLHKLYQSLADSGHITTYYQLRSVIPTGTSAQCDYILVTMYPGAPPKLLGPEELGAALKKAGLTITAQEFYARRNDSTELVSWDMFQNQAFVGGAKKGDYFMVNYMKSANVDDWVAYEKKVWQPFAEAMVKDGVESGWSLNLKVLPRGSDLAFQGVSVDVYPSWDAVFAGDPKFVDRFRKVHPDMEFGTTIEQFEKLRTITSSQLYSLEDMVTAAK
jgi:hypothetical protein